MGTIKALHAVLLQLIRPDMGAKEVCTLSLTGASNSTTFAKSGRGESGGVHESCGSCGSIVQGHVWQRHSHSPRVGGKRSRE